MAKVIIIFEINKHINDFFEKKNHCLFGEKKIPLQWYRDKSEILQGEYNYRRYFIQGSSYRKAIVSPAITMLTIDMSLMRIFSEGPEVSLNGSPTVSPTMVAL